MNPVSDQDVFLAKMQLLYDLHRYPDAEKLAIEYITAHPNSPTGYLQLAIVALLQPGPGPYYHKETVQKGLDAVHRAVALGPNEAHAHYILARLLMRTSRGEKAAFQAIYEALRLRPDSTIYLAQLGRMFLQERQYEQALDAALQGLKIDPQHIETANIQAAALINLGRFAEARLVLTTVLSLDPLDAAAHYNTGRTLLITGEIDLARLHFVEALRQMPGWEPPRKGLIQALKSRDGLYTVGTRAVQWMAQHWLIILAALIGSGGLLAWWYWQFHRLASDIELLILVFTPFTILSGLGALFGLYTMLADIRLRFDPYGRMILSVDEIYSADLSLALLAASAPSLLLGILIGIGSGRCEAAVLVWSSLSLIIPIVMKIMKTKRPS